MGAVHGGGVAAGAGVNEAAARGQVARAVDHMIRWEGCRQCKLPPGEYKQTFLENHRETHEKREAKAREQRDLEAQRQAEEALAKKKAKNWVGHMNRRAKKH